MPAGATSSCASLWSGFVVLWVPGGSPPSRPRPMTTQPLSQCRAAHAFADKLVHYSEWRPPTAPAGRCPIPPSLESRHMHPHKTCASRRSRRLADRTQCKLEKGREPCRVLRAPSGANRAPAGARHSRLPAGPTDTLRGSPRPAHTPRFPRGFAARAEQPKMPPHPCYERPRSR